MTVPKGDMQQCSIQCDCLNAETHHIPSDISKELGMN